MSNRIPVVEKSRWCKCPLDDDRQPGCPKCRKCKFFLRHAHEARNAYEVNTIYCKNVQPWEEKDIVNVEC